MTDNIQGCFARSKAGHDKCDIYIIINEDSNNVWLSDGKLKPIAKPKKKNRKHIQLVDRKDELIEQKLNQHKPIADEDIKRAIKKYISNMKENNTCQSRM